MLYSVAKRQKEIMEKPHEGISTEFSDEDWQINSSPFPKISKFTYDIGNPESDDDWPSTGRPQDVGVDSHVQEGVQNHSRQ